MLDNIRDMIANVDGGSATPGDNARCVIPYHDLRSWLAEAERLGEVTHVTGAGTDEEIGAAAELVMRSDEAPCVVFSQIPGYPKGHRVLANFFGARRKNMTLGFPPELDRVELSEAYYARKLGAMRPVPFEVVSDGPVLQNVNSMLQSSSKGRLLVVEGLEK